MQAQVAEFVGVIVDRQSFLDGARHLTIEGEDRPPTGWQLSLSFRWSVQSEVVTEGDLSLTEPDGGELQASLATGRASEVTDEEGNVNAAQIDLTFMVSGGEGRFANAAGDLRLTGTIAGQGEGTGGAYEGEGVLLTMEWRVEGIAPTAGS